MPALFLSLLKLIFLAFLYLFLWQVARSVMSHTGAGSAVTRPKAGTDVVFVRSESQSGLRVSVKEGVVIGRSDDADVVIDDPYASDLHLRFGLQDGAMVVHDLGSTNGTYVNGRRVTSPVGLSRGDSVQVGKTIMEVR